MRAFPFDDARCSYSLCFNYLKPQDIDHRIEILVVVQQRQLMMGAEGSYYDVNGLPDGYASSPERPVILGTPQGDGLAHHWHKWHVPKEIFRDLELLMALKPLKHFRHDQVTHNDRCLSKSRIEPIRLGGFPAAEVVDPDG